MQKVGAKSGAVARTPGIARDLSITGKPYSGAHLLWVFRVWVCQRNAWRNLPELNGMHKPGPV